MRMGKAPKVKNDHPAALKQSVDLPPRRPQRHDGRAARKCGQPFRDPSTAKMPAGKATSGNAFTAAVCAISRREPLGQKNTSGRYQEPAHCWPVRRPETPHPFGGPSRRAGRLPAGLGGPGAAASPAPAGRPPASPAPAAGESGARPWRRAPSRRAVARRHERHHRPRWKPC